MAGSLVVLMLGAAGGFWVAQKFYKPAPEVVTEYVYKVVEKQREETRKVEEDFVEKKAETEVVERVVVKEVVRYVPVESDPVECNVPIGSVRLLNDARAGTLREDSLPPAAPDALEEGRTPSTVTRRDLIRSDAEIAGRFNECRDQLNSLIDWIDAQQRSLSVD